MAEKAVCPGGNMRQRKHVMEATCDSLIFSGSLALRVSLMIGVTLRVALYKSPVYYIMKRFTHSCRYSCHKRDSWHFFQDTFDIRICLSEPFKYTVDFATADETDLHDMDIPVSFTILQSGTVHGLAFWFDVEFSGSQ